MSPGNGCCLGNGEVVAVDSDDGGRLGGVSGGIVKNSLDMCVGMCWRSRGGCHC